MIDKCYHLPKIKLWWFHYIYDYAHMTPAEFKNIKNMMVPNIHVFVPLYKTVQVLKHIATFESVRKSTVQL